jgi:RNAse (barnase) inhibitor barstar
MRVIDLDAREWKSLLDFYRAVRAAIGAPDWHGWSIDAFIDSMIVHDEINAVAAPYTIRIQGVATIDSQLRVGIDDFADAINKAGAPDRGSDLEVTVAIVP